MWCILLTEEDNGFPPINAIYQSLISHKDMKKDMLESEENQQLDITTSTCIEHDSGNCTGLWVNKITDLLIPLIRSIYSSNPLI